jgi:putative sterol carrier protein
MRSNLRPVSTEPDLSALADAAAQLSDDDIRALLDSDAGGEVVDVLASELPKYVNRDAAPAEPAVLRLTITDRGDELDVVVGPDGAAAQRTQPGAPEPDAALAAGALDMLRLLTGQADPAMLVLRGRLAVQGDVRLAIALAGAFRMPGAKEIDVTDVDPDAIASVVADTPDDQLRAAMDGPVRELVLDEVFRRFPEHVREDRLGAVQGVIAFKVTRSDGGADRHRVAFRDGRCLTGAEAEGGDPRSTIIIDGPGLLKLVTGNLNPPLAFLTRKLRIKGDLAFAAQLPALFRIPGAGSGA